MSRRRWMWFRVWSEQGALEALPAGWAFVVDDTGARVVNDAGAYLIAQVA